MKIILDLCGGTGSWSKPYRDAGYDVRIITLPEYDVTDYSLREYLAKLKPYGILAAPPCTQFSFAKTTGQPRDLRAGLNIVNACLNIIWECQINPPSPYCKTTSVKFWSLENPNGLLKRFLGLPVFEFNPWEFGNSYKKNTHLWGFFNKPKKIFTKEIDVMTSIQISQCKTNSRQFPRLQKFDRLKTREIHPEKYPELDRQARRAITPSGFAKAFFEANK